MISAPLAERMRPKTLDEYIGQEHILATDASLRRAIDSGMIPSMILWGPPGVGKTTLAHLIAKHLERPFHTLSAISSGVKDVREIISNIEKEVFFKQKEPFYLLMKFIVFLSRNKTPY
jgi:putative ATPase